MVVRSNANVMLSVAAWSVVMLAACGGQVAASDPIEDACMRLADRGLGVACGSSLYAASDLARMRPLIIHDCISAANLPGSSWSNPATIDACSTKCGGNCGPTAGSLPGGAACSSDLQCASQSCGGGGGAADPAHPFCGTCGAVAPLGASCVTSNCGAGAACSPTDHVCRTIVFGGDGASCDLGAAQCKEGLVCGSGTCHAPPSVVGAPCDVYGCSANLRCFQGACAPTVPYGGECSDSYDCAWPARCDSSTSACVRIRFVSAGEACDDLRLCAVGSCPTVTSGARCPAILSLGAACDDHDPTAVCDTASYCQGGICHEAEADVCE